MPDTVVIGIDGATYDLIDPWVEEGKLPNFARYLEEGSSSELETTYPPLTAPAWVSFMTGCNPGRHGVYDFLSSDDKSSGVVDYNSIKTHTLWSLFSSQNRRQGLVNIPVTFPPPDVDGHVLSGSLSSSNPTESGRPSDLIEELEQAVGRDWWYRDNTGQTPSKPLQYFQEHYDKNEAMAEYTLHMLEEYEYDFFMVLFDLVDSISHFFWHYMDDSHPYHEDRDEEFSNAILEAYQFVDDFLGQLDEKIGSDTDIVLMSDHGFGPIEYMVNLNNFFRDRGLLEMRKGPSTLIKQGLRKLGITPTKLVKMAETVGLDFLAFALPKSLRNQIIGAMGDYSDVDWDQTVCYSKGHMGQVHLTEQYKSDSDLYREKREEVARELRQNLRHPETDEPVISEIYYREDIYEGPHLEEAPDLFLEMMDFRCIAYPLFSGGKDLFIRHIQEGRYANHRMNGIFCGRGPSFKENNRFSGASIVDLAPMLLYLQDLPLDENMDGQLLERALTDKKLRESPPTSKEYDLGDQPSDGDFTDDDSAQKEARERLEGLGYLG